MVFVQILNNVNKMEKASSFIHKPIYSSKDSAAAEKNATRKKKYIEFIKLFG